jgi:hypothetical protein
MSLFNVICPSFVILDSYAHRITIMSSELYKITKERIYEAIEPQMSAYFPPHIASLSQSREISMLFKPSDTVVLPDQKRWVSFLSPLVVGRYFDMSPFLKDFCIIQDPM